MSSPIEFALVSTFYPPYSFGGDAVHVALLADGLGRRGHTCRVLHAPSAFERLGGRATPDRATEPAETPVGIRQNRRELLSTYLVGGSKSVTRRLSHEVREADIVHFHNPSLLGGPDFMRRPRALRAYTTHEHWLECPMHVLFRNNQEPCVHKTCVRCCLHHRRPPQLWRYTPKLGRAVQALDLILAPSRFTAERHRAEFPDAPIEVLPLPAASSQPGHRPPMVLQRSYVIYAGRFEPIKGIRHLVEAFERLGGFGGVDLVVVGDGSERPAIEHIAARQPAIRLLPRLPHGDVLALIANALAVIVPSIGYETYGGVAVEGMRAGVPAIVRDLGALPELVERGGGFTFRDEGELPAIIARLDKDAVLRARLRTAAQAEFDDYRSEPRFFRRYFELLALAAKRSGRGSLAERLHGAAEAERVPS